MCTYLLPWRTATPPKSLPVLSSSRSRSSASLFLSTKTSVKPYCDYPVSKGEYRIGMIMEEVIYDDKQFMGGGQQKWIECWISCVSGCG